MSRTRKLFAPHQAYAAQLQKLAGAGLTRVVQTLARDLSPPVAASRWQRLNDRFEPGQPVYATLVMRNDLQPCRPYLLQAARAAQYLPAAAAVRADVTLGAVGLVALEDLGARLPADLRSQPDLVLSRYHRDGTASLRGPGVQVALRHPDAARRVEADRQALVTALAGRVRVAGLSCTAGGCTTVHLTDSLSVGAWARATRPDAGRFAGALGELLASLWSSRAALERTVTADGLYWRGMEQAEALGRAVPSLGDLGSRVAGRLTGLQAHAPDAISPCLGAPVLGALRVTPEGELILADVGTAHRGERGSDRASLAIGLARMEAAGDLNLDRDALLAGCDLALAGHGLTQQRPRLEMHRLLLYLRLALLQTRQAVPDGHVRARRILLTALREH